MMTPIYLSLGSNMDRHRHIVAALDALAALLGELHTSSVMKVNPWDLMAAIFLTW